MGVLPFVCQASVMIPPHAHASGIQSGNFNCVSQDGVERREIRDYLRIHMRHPFGEARGPVQKPLVRTESMIECVSEVGVRGMMLIGHNKADRSK